MRDLQAEIELRCLLFRKNIYWNEYSIEHRPYIWPLFRIIPEVILAINDYIVRILHTFSSLKIFPPYV